MLAPEAGGAATGPAFGGGGIAVGGGAALSAVEAGISAPAPPHAPHATKSSPKKAADGEKALEFRIRTTLDRSLREGIAPFAPLVHGRSRVVASGAALFF